MVDAAACQERDPIAVVALQQRVGDNVKRLQEVRRVRWHAESDNLVLLAVVLEIY